MPKEKKLITGGTRRCGTNYSAPARDLRRVNAQTEFLLREGLAGAGEDQGRQEWDAEEG